MYTPFTPSRPHADWRVRLLAVAVASVMAFGVAEAWAMSAGFIRTIIDLETRIVARSEPSNNPPANSAPEPSEPGLVRVKPIAPASK